MLHYSLAVSLLWAPERECAFACCRLSPRGSAPPRAASGCCTFCAPPCLCCFPCGIRPCLFLGGLLNCLPCVPFCAPFCASGRASFCPPAALGYGRFFFGFFTGLSALLLCAAPSAAERSSSLLSCALFPASAAVFTCLFCFCPAAAGSFPASRYPPHCPPQLRTGPRFVPFLPLLPPHPQRFPALRE